MQSIQFKNNSTTSRRGTIPPLETSNPTSAPRTRHSLLLAIATLGLTLILNPVAASAAPQVFEASGATPADILTAVNAFKTAVSLGGGNNGIVEGPIANGRREINWDAVPDAASAPNLLRANFFF